MDTPNRLSAKQLFAYPFRIFFVSVALWAIIAIPLWILAFTGRIHLPIALPPFAWHAHEMLFGFFAVAVAGFLLTAVCNWTQTTRTHGLPLFLMWLAWVAGRLTMLCGGDLPYWLVALVNASFIPLVIFDASKRVWLRGQARQYPLIAVLCLLWLMQLGFLITHGDMHFAFGTLIMAMGVMLIIGGRITPNFSRGWLNFNKPEGAQKITIKPWLEKATLVSIFVLLVAVVAGIIPAIDQSPVYAPLLAVLALLGALITGLRLALWHGWLVLKDPLLWILHLSLLWVPIALLLLSAHAMGWVNAYAWVHALATGAMAGLIIGVMTRVALGHTGRRLVLPRLLVPAYVLIHLGALVRVAIEIVPPLRAHYLHGLYFSAACWTLAFLIFLIRYLPILASQRADGRPG